MNHIKTFYCFIMALTISTIIPLKANEIGFKSNYQDDKLSYTVSFQKEELKRTTVNVSFYMVDSLLYMDTRAQHLSRGWATFVSNIKAVDDSGKPILLEELEGARWKIHAPLHEKINLSYEVLLNHEEHQWSGGIDGVAYAKDWGVFYTGRSLFVMNGDERKDIQVDFILPDDWQVSTSWEAVNEDNTSFTVINIEALTQSMFFAGSHHEIRIKRDDLELIFALGGEGIIAQSDDFEKLAEGVFDYYIDLMGGIPNPSPDANLEKVVVIMNSSGSTDGEVVGNGISILIAEDGDPMSEMIAKFIFAHEFFHLWNGKSFYPENEESEWFKEGVTNYYTLKSLHHVGYLTDESFLATLNNFFYQRYINDEGTGKLSMAKGEEKHDHWGLIYGGGMFAGIAQDLIIRKATQNQKSLDDLMRFLFKKYGGTNDSYTLKELQQTMTELSGIDQTSFFNEHIIGHKIIPIQDYLSSVGLRATVDNNQLIIVPSQESTSLEQKFLEGIYGEVR